MLGGSERHDLLVRRQELPGGREMPVEPHLSLKGGSPAQFVIGDRSDWVRSFHCDGVRPDAAFDPLVTYIEVTDCKRPEPTRAGRSQGARHAPRPPC